MKKSKAKFDALCIKVKDAERKVREAREALRQLESDLNVLTSERRSALWEYAKECGIPISELHIYA